MNDNTKMTSGAVTNSSLPNARKMLKQSSHYLIGNTLCMAASFVSFPILTHAFSVGDYGIFGLVTATIFILVAIGKFGSQYSAIRYYDEQKRAAGEGLATYYTTFSIQSVLFSAAAAILIVAAYELFPRTLGKQFGSVLWLVALLSITSSLIVRLNNFIRVEQKTELYNAITVVHHYARLAAGLGLMFTSANKLASFLGGQLLVDVLVLSFLTVRLCTRQSVNLKRLSLPLFKNSVSYGLPLVLLELSTLFLRYADRYLIRAGLKPEPLGLYTVASNLSQYIEDVLFLPVALAIFPLYMEIWTRAGRQAVERFLGKAVNYLSAVCIPIIFGTSLLARDLVVSLASVKFDASARLMPLLIVGRVMWGFHHVLAAGLYIQKKTGVLASIILCMSGLNIVLNLLLLPVLGILGSALSMLGCYLLMLALVIRASFRYLIVKVDLQRVLRYVAASLAMSVVVYSVRLQQPLSSLVVRSASGALTYLLVLAAIDGEVRAWTGAALKRAVRAARTLRLRRAEEI